MLLPVMVNGTKAISAAAKNIWDKFTSKDKEEVKDSLTDVSISEIESEDKCVCETVKDTIGKYQEYKEARHDAVISGVGTAAGTLVRGAETVVNNTRQVIGAAIEGAQVLVGKVKDGVQSGIQGVVDHVKEQVSEDVRNFQESYDNAYKGQSNDSVNTVRENSADVTATKSTASNKLQNTVYKQLTPTVSTGNSGITRASISSVQTPAKQTELEMA